MRKTKLALIWILILLVLGGFISLQQPVYAYAGIDDAVVAGVGCIVGAFAWGGSCKAYNPPKDNYNCGICNDRDKFPFGKCTEYQCRAIGRNCRFVPSLKNSKEGFCMDNGRAVYQPPKVVSCGVIDISTMRAKPDVKQIFGTSGVSNSNNQPVGGGVTPSDFREPEINPITGSAVSSGNSVLKGCDLGNLALDKQYAFILSTDIASECRFSRTPNRKNLFNANEDVLLEGVYQDDTDDVAYQKIVANAKKNNFLLFTEMPNGVDHLWPIYFGTGWTPENIKECNEGGCTWYAQCADFDGSNVMDKDFMFTFKIVDPVGDTDAPKIIDFNPEDRPGLQRYTLPLQAKGDLNVEFSVSDVSGVQECRYSDNNVGFSQMNLIQDCKPATNQTSQFLQTCNIPLTGIKEGNNFFYFNCMDASDKKNINPINYVYNVVGAGKLTLQIKTPKDGETIDGLNDTLHVVTSGGVDGTAICKYNYAKVGGGASGTNLVFASDTPGSENKKEHKQEINFLTENGEYILTINCADFNDPENTANGDLKIKFEKSQIMITKESPSALIVERSPVLKVRTSGYDNGRAECRLYDKQSITVFDDRSGVSMISSGNLLHQFIFKDLTLGKHSSSVVCRSLDKNIQNSLEISFEIVEKLPTACTPQTQCPLCSNNKYCVTVVGSGKHLCDPSKVKQSCVNGFCSEVNCPSGDKFSTDYCEDKKDDLCLSDKDKDGAADNLDCNDKLTSIGQCSIDQCKKCSEDESRDDNTGICVDILVGCTPKGSITQPPGAGTGQPRGECRLTRAIWVDTTGRNQLSGNVNENTKVNAALQGQNCQGQSFNLELYELDDRGLLGKSFEKITTLNFPSQVVFGDQGVAFAEWEVKWLEDNGGINDDPEFVFRAANTNIESSVINVKKIPLPADAKLGDSCKTSDNCDGIVRDTNGRLECVKRDPRCPASTGTIVTPLNINSVSSSKGNIIVVTSKGIGDDGSANCAVYNNIAMTNKISDLASVDLGDKTMAHSYTHAQPGNYNSWYVKCADNNNANDFRTREVPSFSISSTVPATGYALEIDGISSDEGNIVAVTSGGIDNDGSANCAVYNNIAMTGKISDLNAVSLSARTKAQTYTHNLAGSYSGWYVKCIDDKNSNDFKTKLVPTFRIVSAVVSGCGNNVLDLGEVCDGNLLAGKTCNNLGFNSGNLRCKNDCKEFDTSSCSSPVQAVPGNNCSVNNCPGIYNTNNVCVDIGGDNCPAVITQPQPTQPSSLRVVSKGPSGIQADTRVNLSITLSGGPSNYGQEAECRYRKASSDFNLNVLIDNYDSILFPNTMNSEVGDIGTTKYKSEVNVGIGEHTYYIKCKDTLGRLTDPQTITFEVRIPVSQQISIVRKSPDGEYGSKNVALAVETNGGLDNGASVNCNYEGIIGSGNLIKQQITGGRYAHLAIVPNVPDGDYAVTVSCVDRANQIASTTLNINVQEDKIAPVEQLIITRGSSKFITVSEAAECEASNDNVNWQKVGSDQNRRKHVVTLSGTYYFRCKDLWNNQMPTVKINP